VQDAPAWRVHHRPTVAADVEVHRVSETEGFELRSGDWLDIAGHYLLHQAKLRNEFEGRWSARQATAVLLDLCLAGFRCVGQRRIEVAKALLRVWYLVQS